MKDTKSEPERPEAVVNEFGTLEVTVEKVRPAFEKGVRVGLVYLDFYKISRMDDHYGPEFVDIALKEMTQFIHEWKRKDLPYLDVFPAGPVRGDDFVVFFVPKAAAHLHWTEGLLLQMANTIREELVRYFSRRSANRDGEEIEFFLGWSAVDPVDGIPWGRVVYRAIRQATDFAAEQRFSEESRSVSELKQIIDGGKLTTVFQPILHLESRTFLGYEALARGPEGSRFSHPEVIFDTASRGRFLLKAERLAKISAMEAAQGIPSRYKLFLNVESELFVDPEEILKMLREVGCLPGRVVFEITERKAVKDFDQLQKVVRVMKDEGYHFAVDDAGSGYASMESIAILDPHYIKIDQSIIHDIEKNFVKQDVVRAFINLSKMRHSLVIAEGVENEGEYRMLRSLGVEYAQGFFFAHPGMPPAREDQIPPY